MFFLTINIIMCYVFRKNRCKITLFLLSDKIKMHKKRFFVHRTAKMCIFFRKKKIGYFLCFCREFPLLLRKESITFVEDF